MRKLPTRLGCGSRANWTSFSFYRHNKSKIRRESGGHPNTILKTIILNGNTSQNHIPNILKATGHKMHWHVRFALQPDTAQLLTKHCPHVRPGQPPYTTAQDKVSDLHHSCNSAAQGLFDAIPNLTFDPKSEV
eukprot:3170700-Amphidinium_carterae.1